MHEQRLRAFTNCETLKQDPEQEIAGSEVAQCFFLKQTYQDKTKIIKQLLTSSGSGSFSPNSNL